MDVSLEDKKPPVSQPSKAVPDDDNGRVKGISDDDILEEARTRFAEADSGASENRAKFKMQMGFIGGEQWDSRLKSMRESQFRPCLTFDRLTTCVNQVVNNMRQNKPAIKVHPVNSDASVETAKCYDGIVRHVERVSDADIAYETAGWTAVAAGQGGWRVLTEFEDETSFNQELRIKRESNPMSYWFDPMALEPDASDMRYCFIATDMPKKQFERDNPDIDLTSWNGFTPNGWWSEDSVRVCEYFRVVLKDTTLFYLDDGSSCNEEEYDERKKNGGNLPAIKKRRPGKRREIQWFKLGGATVLDSRCLDGNWIPVVRVIGNEVVLDGKIEYTGMTWRAMDAQRTINYSKSVVIETIAMQPKAPFIGAKGQFTGQEAKWRGANNSMAAYLEYEPITIDGNLAPAPQRQSPPTVPTGVLEMMNMAEDDLKWVTGLQAPSFGANSAAKSGRAITAEQQQGDTATYHYLDNLSRSIRHTGRILVDLIPYVYDTPRILRILGEDGEVDYAESDTTQPEAYKKVEKADGTVKSVYNLGVGKYDVAVAVGPSFTTKRLEAVDAMTGLLQVNPALFGQIGDLYLRQQDWPGAAAMADRLKKTLPPGLADDEHDQGSPEQKLAQLNGQAQEMHQALSEIVPRYQQSEQQLQQLQGEMADLQKQLSDKQQEYALREYEIESKAKVAAYEAETDRAKVVAPAMDPQTVQLLIEQTVRDLMTAPSPNQETIEMEQPGMPPQDDGSMHPFPNFGADHPDNGPAHPLTGPVPDSGPSGPLQGPPGQQPPPMPQGPTPLT